MKSHSKKIIMVICAVLTCVVTALTIVGLTACSSGWKELPKNARKFDYMAWNLEFSDEFDGAELNTDYWNIRKFEEDGQIRRAGIYVDDSDIVYVKNSNLVISTKYKTTEYGEGWHTAWVDSSVPKDDPNKGYATKHGYFEVRCIVPPSVGIWSAFWMMPASGVGMSENDILGTGKDGVEIDIMESPYMYQKGEKSLVTHVVHGDGYRGKTVSDKSPTYRVDDMYSTFHTYGVEWNDKEYIFYVDGIETWRTQHSDGNGGVLGVSDELEHMILSVEVAGTKEKNSDKLIPGKVYNDKTGELEDYWCGNPDLNDKTKSYDFIIDYVRVYKAK